MNRRAKFIVDILAFITLSILVVGIIFVSINKDQASERAEQLSRLEEGQFFFSFYNIKNDKKFFSDLKGHVILVNVWATWCAPCVQELPSLIQLAKKVKKLKILILTDEPKTVVQPFLSEFEKPSSNFIIGFHPDVFHLFSIQALPETFIFDKKQHLIERVIGPRRWHDMNWVNKINQWIRST